MYQLGETPYKWDFDTFLILDEINEYGGGIVLHKISFPNATNLDAFTVSLNQLIHRSGFF